jgi:predicted transcriptional regulator
VTNQAEPRRKVEKIDVHLRLDQDVHSALSELAGELDRTVPNLASQILKAHVTRGKTG